MKLLRLLPISLLLGGLIACNESNTIGSSLVQDKIEIVIDSTFSITGSSVANPIIQSRTSNQLLGKIDAKGYGYLATDFLTQLMPSNAIDTVGVTANDLDSIQLRMFMSVSGYVGDTLAPMALQVFRLNKEISAPIYSNVNPQQYYSPSDLLASTGYSASVVGLSDDLFNRYTNPDSAVRMVNVKLPISLAKEFFNKYKQDPSLFNDPQRFADWFPGLYIKNNFGSGRIMQFYASNVYLFYKKKQNINGKDSIFSSANVIMSVTPEVVLGNSITFDISNELKEHTKKLPTLVAPAGYNVDVKIPIREMLAKYKSQSNTYTVINTLKLEVPVEDIENDYNITAPNDMLLIRKDKVDEFFSKQQINDNVNSFYATYNASTKSYSFNSMRQYFIDMTKKGSVTDADGEFVLIPVTPIMELEQTGYTPTYVVMALLPYAGIPSMATVKMDETRFVLTFSNQSI